MKIYLVYQLSEQEMGSEGYSTRFNFEVVEAESESEAIHKWHKQHGTTTELYENNGHWFCYYEVVANELPTVHYGAVEKFKIIDCWNACVDDPKGKYHYEHKEKEY